MPAVEISPTSIGGGVVTSIVGPSNAPATGRGVIVLLGTHSGVNFNSVAATNIFTTPASGFAFCVITDVVVLNASSTMGAAAASYGASATPTDLFPAAGFDATMNVGRFWRLSTVSNLTATAPATYGTNVGIVCNVTVAKGTAVTADVQCWGYYTS